MGPKSIFTLMHGAKGNGLCLISHRQDVALADELQVVGMLAARQIRRGSYFNGMYYKRQASYLSTCCNVEN